MKENTYHYNTKGVLDRFRMYLRQKCIAHVFLTKIYSEPIKYTSCIVRSSFPLIPFYIIPYNTPRGVCIYVYLCVGFFTCIHPCGYVCTCTCICSRVRVRGQPRYVLDCVRVCTCGCSRVFVRGQPVYVSVRERVHTCACPCVRVAGQPEGEGGPTTPSGQEKHDQTATNFEGLARDRSPARVLGGRRTINNSRFAEASSGSRNTLGERDKGSVWEGRLGCCWA